MSKLRFRVSIVQAAVAIALLWSSGAAAQVYPAQAVERGGLVNNIATGVHYDIANQRMAERRLNFLQAKLNHHAASGQSAAADRDVHMMRNMRYRIVVDEWLIRKNMGLDPGCYPYPLCMDPITYNAIAQYHQPLLFP
jgi:hypothetical protein